MLCKAAIENMQKVMQDDDEIIRLRETIRRRTEAAVENGTKTVNDLLHDMNAENAARRCYEVARNPSPFPSLPFTQCIKWRWAI